MVSLESDDFLNKEAFELNARCSSNWVGYFCLTNSYSSKGIGLFANETIANSLEELSIISRAIATSRKFSNFTASNSGINSDFW